MTVATNMHDRGRSSYPNGGARHRRSLRILVCTSGVSGHIVPMIRVAEQLVQRGYIVTFLAIDEFQTTIENIGATFRHIDNADLTPLHEWYHEGWTRADLAVFFTTSFIIGAMAHQKDRLYSALEEMRGHHDGGPSTSSDEIVVLTESLFVGAMPMYYGGPPPKGFTQRPKIINLHSMGYMVGSVDLPPFGLGLPPSTTPEERAGYQALLESLLDGTFKDVNLLFEQEIVRLGGVDFKRRRQALPYEICSISNDICLHMSPPSLEYAISDLHPKVKLIGTLPLGASKTFDVPSFWGDIVSGDKKLIVVTQGTVEQNYRNLLLPTLYALEGSSDLLVVAILGRKGASLGDARIPGNARVVDYLPYDAILPYASAFVLNAGYGGFIHGVVNGVPMVFAGETEEKPEVANRGGYAGVGINLGTGHPSEQQLLHAVNKLLEDSRYQKRVVEVKEENEKLRAMDTIEKTILSS